MTDIYPRAAVRAHIAGDPVPDGYLAQLAYPVTPGRARDGATGGAHSAEPDK